MILPDYLLLGISDFLPYCREWYKNGYREYHTFSHAVGVAENCFSFLKQERKFENCAAVTLAALYHDAVYITGSDSNEKCSALALLNDARRINYLGGCVDMVVVERAAELVLGTTLGHHMSPVMIRDPELAMLLDCDLRSLALSYNRFIEQQTKISRENFLQDTDLKKSAIFLKKFLDAREYIYHTVSGRYFFEEFARENIEKLCAENNI